ncbi:hypothetical protein KY290_034889 [Solanum tuberosum]|uniref:Uncharacterized protein n=1 Tax=Solanum tuberosum TaxID=4113 RepID=A0ABQ7U4X1_SOLTU|nr:hypothetical protein KY289_034485 [Solanum tuberosum]KAH0646148.1 hypothetical protein KY284_034032 [Solanum tuberosum]KAH0700638.1 hypothetical protein KY284_014853 [Solanum tuberosum]KAH0718845.1 hypothetical protein KY285_014876 [Solanum tuberosum]KAH0741846.1 hypothetical protein KY290_034889 [Solanum tuberosum]
MGGNGKVIRKEQPFGWREGRLGYHQLRKGNAEKDRSSNYKVSDRVNDENRELGTAKERGLDK